MRILLTHHFPLDFDSAGRFAWALAERLSAAGHEVRGLVVGATDQAAPVPTRSVADAAVWFSAGALEGPTFQNLSDQQLATHRDVLRKALDAEIESFNPHLLHAQHIWLLGHLALEMGVPYVLSAWEAELTTCRLDNRYVRLAQEAAENAGRILVSALRLADEVHALFGELDGRVTAADGQAAWLADGAAPVMSIYREVLTARYGPRGSLDP